MNYKILNLLIVIIGVLCLGCKEQHVLHDNGSDCIYNHLGRIDRCENKEVVCYRFHESLQCRFKRL